MGCSCGNGKCRMPDPGLNWKARKWAAFAVCCLLSWRHGEEASETWLWSLTPFPASVPTWEQVVFGSFAAIAPASVHVKLMNHMLKRVDIEIERAMSNVRG